MAQNLIDILVPPLATTIDVSVPAGAQIAVFSRGSFSVYQLSSGNNVPSIQVLLKRQPAGEAQYQSGVLDATNAVNVRIEADGQMPTFYNIGVSASVLTDRIAHGIQPAPNALNATGALTAAMILGGIVTSTTAAAVAGTVPTGAVMDDAVTFPINGYVDWSIINTGPNDFTVTAAASGHTIVGGNGAAFVVPTLTAAMARTRRTAADTWITYSISRPVS